ncbi:hypothetical protein SARC_06810 [Sphaeroforma arctica JP610]|uniref:Uncharacterized protein n=1 Tax=Sphaeroforma arctica JP610 TaxID=667725 RepID=A0A0L0FXY9_9EUKA|nr:hypothetical protein SARC_06810 [Sphaeroforma arctica JP610]KNC80828.1 hypothetical protein SARC_06810 [Sphaeroforma arctica JP610]|eukprot:XP_014154730.1 hypothetical protein SARC_06810 [Sphaeroforma arctica JP610]
MTQTLTSTTEMVSQGIELRRGDGTDSGFVSSDTSDSMPALLTNESSASEPEEDRRTQEIERNTRRMGLHNRRQMLYNRSHHARLNARVMSPESKKRKSERKVSLETTPRTNRIRRQEVLGQDQQRPTPTSTWTLRAIPSYQFGYTPDWTAIHPQDVHSDKRRVQKMFR